MDAAAETRLGIPLLIGEDGIHGHSFHPGATIFPTQLAMACSWNEQLLEAAARVTAREMATTGAHWTFSPVLCLSRDLRWGRTGETFGEDPFLIGELGAAMIRGYQGAGLDDADGVLACAKHYAGYSETQGGRDASEADISRRKLRSFFLPPFERAARAGCMTFMTGYQSMDGLPSTANHWLLTQVLKEEWGFAGILVTDWDNVGRLHWEQRIVPVAKEAAVVAVRCGNDLIMATPSFFEAAQAAVREGLLAETEIDAVVRRILTLKFRMGLFENPRRPNREQQATVIASAEHRALNLDAGAAVAGAASRTTARCRSRAIACEKSRSSAPTPTTRWRSSAIGRWAARSTRPARAGTRVRARSPCSTAFARARQQSVSVAYARGCTLSSADTSEIPAALAACADADVIVLAVGRRLAVHRRDAQHGHARAAGRSVGALGRGRRLGQTAGARAREQQTAGAARRRANARRRSSVASTRACRAARPSPSCSFGDFNPSGKLTISFPKHVGQQPSFYSQVRGQHGAPYADLDQVPRFAFGFGLSYTHFEYSSLSLAKSQLAAGRSARAELRASQQRRARRARRSPRCTLPTW